MRSVSFEVPGEPRGKGRPRFTRRGAHVTTYTPEATASYENLIKLYAHKAANGESGWPAGVPLTLAVIAVFPVPASWSKRKRLSAYAGMLLPTGPRVDVDNVLKVVCDALNGVLWADDGQVVHATVSRRYIREGEMPRLLVKVNDGPWL